MAAIKTKGVLTDAEYLRLIQSLVMTEFNRRRHVGDVDGKVAYANAMNAVADLVGRDHQEFREWFSTSVTIKARGIRWAKHKADGNKPVSPEVPEEIDAVAGVGEDTDNFPVPEIKTAVEDPFAADEIVDKLVKAFKDVKIGVPVYQTYPTHNHAKTAGSLINRVSHKLKWKQYKKIVDGCILWVKRTK